MPRIDTYYAMTEGMWKWLQSSEDGNSTRWASDTTFDMQRCRGQEEGPSAILFACLAQRLEIPHLADGCAPFDEKPFVEGPWGLEWRWPGCKNAKSALKAERIGGYRTFEGNRVASHSGKVLVIEPTDRGFVILEADGNAVLLGALFAFLGTSKTRECQC